MKLWKRKRRKEKMRMQNKSLLKLIADLYVLKYTTDDIRKIVRQHITQSKIGKKNRSRGQLK